MLSRLPKVASSLTEKGLLDVCYRDAAHVLLFAEGNFSFAHSLLKLIPNALIVATEKATTEQRIHRIRKLESTYPQSFQGFLDTDLRKLNGTFASNAWDVVVCNFPIVKRRGMSNAHSDQLKLQYNDTLALCQVFLREAERLLKPGGEAHLRLTDQFSTIALTQHDIGPGLKGPTRVDFGISCKTYSDLGYRPLGFKTDFSSTFIFTKSV
eukprot:GEMP01093343.1.p1 GENE.GEMP01093343.1~~GEMP01093343.1.p1  ORF type:complete len:210 (+),score=34.80 GEMP01093343.1:249-878(+)